MRPMWTCSECGRQFANRNQWHSCTRMTEADHLANKTPHARKLYRAFKRAVRECGPSRVHAQKTRIAFITRMSFASATLQKRWITVGLIAPRTWDSHRFHKVEVFAPSSVGHSLKVSSLDEIDDELRGWIREAYHVGTQMDQERYRTGPTG